MSPLMFVTDFHHAIGVVNSNVPAVIDAVVRGSIVLALASLLTSAMRRVSAATRHVVWVSAILATLTIPVLGHFAPHWNARVLPAGLVSTTFPAAYDNQPATSAAAATSADVSAATSGGMSVPISTTTSATTTTTTYVSARPESSHQMTTRVNGTHRSVPRQYEYLVLIWLAGAAIVLARLAIGTIIVWRTARRATRVEESTWLVLVNRTAREIGIARPITLLTSAQQVVPVTWGIVYPVVLLPDSALDWDQERREAVLVHELAHVARLDALTQTIVQLALAAFWFNPLMWMAARHVRTERERACDDLVLSHGTHASFYAADLLTMVRTLTRNTEPAFAALGMARRSEFEGRMLAILDPNTDRRGLGARGAAAALAATLVIALPLAALRPLPRTVDGESLADLPTAPTTKAYDALQRHVSGTTGPARSVVIDGLSCRNESGNHLHINSDDSESTFMISDNQHCLIARSTGKVVFSDDDAHIQSISPGGHISIAQLRDGVEHQYEARPTSTGLEESYLVGGKPADATVRDAWLRIVIPQIVRQDASLAPARAARIRRERGIAGLLAEVDSIKGDYARTAYLAALLNEGHITQDSLNLIATFGAHKLDGDYYKSQFLGHVSLLSHSGSTSGILATAAHIVSSDYYRRQVLSSALAGSRDNGAMLAQVIASSNEVSSAYDRAAILSQVLSRGQLSDSDLMALIGSADGIDADYERATVLDSVASGQPLTSAHVYTMLLKSADGISGSYERAQVLRTILARRDLTPDLAAATLTDAATLSTDTDKADMLAAVAQAPVMRNTAVRQAYFATAKTITSSSDYRRAVSAVLP